MRWLLILAIVLPLAAQPAKAPQDKGSPEANRAESTAHDKDAGSNQGQATQPTPSTTQTPVAMEGNGNPSAASSQTHQNSQQAPDEDLKIQRILAWCTGALVVVGILQFFALIGQVVIYCRQAAIMARQAHEMKRQRAYMRLQWRAMQDQITQMASSGTQTEQLIEQAAKQAEQLAAVAGAGKLSAEAAQNNIELIIRKERARLIFEIGKPPKRSAGEPLFIPFTVRHEGTTSAFNVESRVNAIISESYDFPENRFLNLSMELPTLILPSFGVKMFGARLLQMIGRWNTTLNEETVARVANQTATLHFWGFIRYTDFFDRPRETTFRYRLVTGPDEEFIEYWEPYGPPEDNHQT